MTKATLAAIAARWAQDEAFRRALEANPTAALSGYDLTPEEFRAVAARDERRLIGLGLDERIVKGSLN